MSKIHIAVGCIGLLLTANAAAELRTYDVDFRYQHEVYEALRNILQVDKSVSPAMPILSDFSYGSVQLLPTGQIVVDTSAATHAQIEELLESIRARQTEATPRVTLRYWVVLGTSAEGAAGAAPPPVLSDVLSELRRLHGDLNFGVLGTATLVTESGQEGQVISTPLGAKQRVFVQSDTATAAIELQYVEPETLRRALAQTQQQPVFATLPDPYVGKVVLNVTLERGEFLVLGESTVRTFQLDGTLFYIAHWPSE